MDNDSALMLCTVARDGLNIDGSTYDAGDVVQLNPAFAHDLINENEVERLDL